MRTHSRMGWIVLVTVTVGALILASCSTRQVSPSTSTTEGKPYGSLTVLASAKGDLDPAMVSGSAYTSISVMFDSLVDLTPEARPKPGIAERWEIGKDGKTHTFYIRKGVKFHNGDDLTGADVKFSIERMVSPQSIQSSAGVWRSQVTGVELKDEYTVVLHLKQPQFELLTGLDSQSGVGAVMPKRYIEEKGVEYFTKNPVGSGPFKFVSFIPGTRLEVEAVESHWRAVPKFKNISFIFVSEEATAIAMLKTGELDIAEVSPDSVALLKSAGLRIFAFDGHGQYFLAVFHDVDNPDKWAVADVRVRKALSLAINRQELADKIFGGYARPGFLYNSGPSTFFWDPNVLKPDPYDPQQAKKMLADAGYANGFYIKIFDTGKGVGLNTLNQAITGYWRAIGLNAEIVPKEYALATKMFNPKQVPEIWGGVYAGLSTGGYVGFEKMFVIYHSKGNFKTVLNSRLDELIDKVPLTVDMAEKKRLAIEATLLAKNDYGVINVVDRDSILALSLKVGSVTPTVGLAGLLNYETITHSK